MNIILFGATGMVGQGALRECLLAPDVHRVLAIGRSATGVVHDKLHEIIQPDLCNYAAIENELSGYDACLFCLGVSSAGMTEADYTRITHDIPLAAAKTLARLNPGMTFILITAVGTDSSEKGNVMWARVKGRTENALLRLPFKAVYAFRPGGIQPLHGIRSRTLLYRVLMIVGAPLFPLLHRLFPNHITTTEELGRAMLIAARHGAPKPILEAPDFIRLARAEASTQPQL